MKLYRYILAAGLVAVLAVTCKKEDEDTVTSKTMNGTLSLSTTMPSYVTAGERYTFTPSGLYLDDADSAAGLAVEGCYFKTNIASEHSDTVKLGESYVFTVPDSLATCTLTCTAYASGYYTRSASVTFTVVSESRSLEGLPSTGSTFTDVRNAQTYPVSENGSLEWMDANLRYFEKDPSGLYTFGLPFENSPAMENIFGAFYTWSQALSACPEGWRVPSVSDWDTLGSSAGALICPVSFNGNQMWEFWPAVSMTNSTGFCALPLGYAAVGAASFDFMGVYSYSAFWADDSGTGQVRYFYAGEDDIKVWSGVSQDGFAVPVRCVRDI